MNESKIGSVIIALETVENIVRAKGMLFCGLTSIVISIIGFMLAFMYANESSLHFVIVTISSLFLILSPGFFILRNKFLNRARLNLIDPI